ncbi:MAG: hypothetical protein WCB15_11755 [Desulfobacterales bacterium]
MDSCSFLTITIGTRAGTLIRAGAGGVIRAETVAGTVAQSVTVTARTAFAKAVTVTALTAAAMTIAVAAAISASVATSISAAATVAAAISTTTTTAAAGQDDPGLEGVIGRRDRIRGKAFTGARRVDRTGSRAPGRYGCQK